MLFFGEWVLKQQCQNKTIFTWNIQKSGQNLFFEVWNANVLTFLAQKIQKCDQNICKVIFNKCKNANISTIFNLIN